MEQRVIRTATLDRLFLPLFLPAGPSALMFGHVRPATPISGAY